MSSKSIKEVQPVPTGLNFTALRRNGVKRLVIDKAGLIKEVEFYPLDMGGVEITEALDKMHEKVEQEVKAELDVEQQKKFEEKQKEKLLYHSA